MNVLDEVIEAWRTLAVAQAERDFDAAIRTAEGSGRAGRVVQRLIADARVSRAAKLARVDRIEADWRRRA